VSVYWLSVEPSLLGAVQVTEAEPLSPAVVTVGAEGVAGTADGTTPPTGPATEAALVPLTFLAVTVKV